MYVKYCENKPKSEFLVAEYIDYFEVWSLFIINDFEGLLMKDEKDYAQKLNFETFFRDIICLINLNFVE